MIKNVNYMKKAIIGLSALVIFSFVVLLFVNAQTDAPKGKKAQTEVTAKCCPSATACPKAAQASAGCAEKKEIACDPEKCKELGCDPATCPKAKAEGCKMQASAPACGKPCPMSALK